MAHRPDDQPVVGYFEHEFGAGQAAREIRAGGIRAGVTSGAEVADSRFGGHLLRGLVIGVLIAVPFALVLPLLAWAHDSAGVNPLFSIGWLGLPILFVGAFIGLMVQASRHEMSRRARARLVVTEPALSPSATDKTTTTINELGGDLVQTPKPGPTRNPH